MEKSCNGNFVASVRLVACALSLLRPPTMPRKGTAEAIPDCPPFYGDLPDRFGHYGTNGVNNQGVTHLERNRDRDKPAPAHYRPPPGQWTPQTGMGSLEMRFTTRVYKPDGSRPPDFRVKGSQPLRKGSSYPRAHDCTKFPEYSEDPWDEKIKANREKLKKERELITAPFKPAGNGGKEAAFKPRYTSTITFRPSNFRRG